jgi:hypothetical protein
MGMHPHFGDLRTHLVQWLVFFHDLAREKRNSNHLECRMRASSKGNLLPMLSNAA